MEEIVEESTVTVVSIADDVGDSTIQRFSEESVPVSKESTVTVVSTVDDVGDSTIQQFSDLDPEESVPVSSIRKAAYLVDQTFTRQLVPLEMFDHANYPKAKQAYAIYNRLSFIRSASLLVLALLPIVNEPDWCSNKTPSGHCDKSGKYLLSGVKYLPKSIFFLLEFMCILPLAVSLILERYYKFSTFWAEWSTTIKVGLLVAMGFHLIASVSQISWLVSYQSKQMGMYLCILIPLFFSRSLRACFHKTMLISHSYLDTAVILVVFILLSAWLACQLFHQPSFRDFRTSVLNLFILLTTVNNPNVWAPTYKQNRLSFFFFFTYMVIAYFFLMQLLFALIYNNYKVQLTVSVQNHSATQARNLHKAFNLLNLHQAGINVQTANALFIEISSYRHIHVQDRGAMVNEIMAPCLSQGNGENIDSREKEKNIDFVEFKVLCSRFMGAVELKLHDVPRTKQPSKRRFDYFEDILESAGYVWLLFAATLASLVVAVLAHNIRDSKVADIWPWRAGPSKFRPSLETLTKCEFLFGSLFLANVAFRMWIQGIKKYFLSVVNCFDCVATLVIIGFQISTIWNSNAYNGISISIIIRAMRYITLLGYFSRWRFMGDVIISMIPATAPVLGFQLCVCALFSVSGVHIFGGQVFVGNPRLSGTDYATSHLWVYNYNDFGSAMVTSFNLCIVNNWYVIMDGYVAATGTGWARAYFVTFWTIAVAVCLNVVVAFFVGAFVGQLERAEHVKFLYLLAPSSSKKRSVPRDASSIDKYDLYEDIARR